MENKRKGMSPEYQKKADKFAVQVKASYDRDIIKAERARLRAAVEAMVKTDTTVQGGAYVKIDTSYNHALADVLELLEETGEPGERCEVCNGRFTCYATRNKADTKWICNMCQLDEIGEKYGMKPRKKQS